LTDDLNTPQAITELHSLRNLAQGGDTLACNELASSLQFFGLLQETAAEWTARKQQAKGLDPADVEILITARRQARQEKKFAEADRIRDELAAMGVVLKDSKDGTTWEVAR
jgi:cysteinyl-tRNA synthetase